MLRIMTSALILFAHGSRDPQWCRPLESIRDRIANTAPQLRVELAYLELQAPALEDVVARLVATLDAASVHVRVMPMFLGQGGHLRRDVAERVAKAVAAHPGLRLELLPSLGESDQLLEAMAHSIAARATQG